MHDAFESVEQGAVQRKKKRAFDPDAEFLYNNPIILV